MNSFLVNFLTKAEGAILILFIAIIASFSQSSITHAEPPKRIGATKVAPPMRWVLLSGYDLNRLMSGNGITTQTLEGMTTAGLSWPDGRQSVVTTFRIRASDGASSQAFLYRCIDYYSARMEWSGQACYEARS